MDVEEARANMLRARDDALEVVREVAPELEPFVTRMVDHALSLERKGMKDFDEGRMWEEIPEERRTFRLRGETLVIRERVRPDGLARATALDGKAGIHEELVAVDHACREFIEPGFHEAWERVRANVDDPLQLSEMWSILTWMVEATTQLPTLASSSSRAGRDPVETSSQGASSSPEATPAP